MAALDEMVAFLDRELRVADFESKDSSHNGLQVAGPGRIDKVCCGVDASQEFFEQAARRGAGLAICHHGLSWGDSLARITGLNYARLSFLVRNDLALYACHLPLDAHPLYGNNARLCAALGLAGIEPFGMYHGVEIGFAGRLPEPMPYDAFKSEIGTLLGSEPRCMDFGKETVETVAVVSGGAADQVNEAALKGIDVYLSGEPLLFAYNLAREYEINAVFAGHYATEKFGVQAVGELLAREFDVRAEFVELNVPF